MSIQSFIPESSVPVGSLAKLLLEKLKETGADPALIDCPSGEIWNGHKVRESVLRCSLGLVEVVGVRKGDVVCVYSGNSALHSVAFISIIAVGGIHTACSSYNTLRELIIVMVDTEASYLICSLEHIDIAIQAIIACQKNIGLLVFADDDVIESNGNKTAVSFNKLLKYENEMVPVEVNDEDIVAIMASSGSTAKPKQIIQTHKTLKSLVMQSSHDEVFGLIKGKDVFSAHISIQSAVGCFSLIHPILSHVSVALQPGFDPVLFMKYVDKYKITSGFLGPTDLIKLIDCPTPDGCDLSSLVNIASGGSFMPKNVPDRLRAKIPCLKLRTCYGLTETGYVAIVYKNDAGTSLSLTSVPTVGKPFPGMKIKIIDPETNKTQPIGESGEICVSGNTVTPGYYNLPLKHEELFVDGTFFRTGDIGHLDSDGNIYVERRAKDEIKVGSITVSPAELELLLLSHEDVREAAVVGISDEVYVEVPKAFVVLKNGRTCREETLIEFINNQVNPFKQLRGGITFLNELPTSPIGKVQKSKLKLL